MDTFWLKILLFAVLVVGVIVFIGFLTSGTKEPEKTFYDQVEEDKQEFLAEPKPLKEQQTTPETTQETTEETAQIPQESLEAEDKETVEPAPPVQQQVEQPEPAVLYFKPLSEIDQIEAEKLLNVAVPGRSIGRLPMTGFSLMVPNCRQIIERWPDSRYAYQAKRLLADLPERYKMRYKITKEEMDVSMFYKQRPGTQPFTMEESR